MIMPDLSSLIQARAGGDFARLWQPPEFTADLFVLSNIAVPERRLTPRAIPY